MKTNLNPVNPKMKTTRSLLRLALALPIAWNLSLTPGNTAAAAPDLPTLLQQGVTEEEANRDLPAALRHYEALLQQFDQDRTLAVTALFRRGECQRKLGQTNEAITAYQRVLREFPEAKPFAQLSQQNLAALGVVDGKAGQRPVAGNKTSTETADEWCKWLSEARHDLEMMWGDVLEAKDKGLAFTDEQKSQILKHQQSELDYAEEALPMLKLSSTDEARVRRDLFGARRNFQLLQIHLMPAPLVGGKLAELPPHSPELTAAEAELQAAERAARDYHSVSGRDRLAYALQHHPQPLLEHLAKQRLQLQQDEAALANSVAETHPDRQALRAKLITLNVQLEEHLQGIANLLQARILSAQDGLDRAKKRAQDALEQATARPTAPPSTAQPSTSASAKKPKQP